MSDWRKHILKAMLGALAITALAAVAAVAFSNDAMWRIAGTTFTGAITTLLVLRLSSMVDEPRTRWAGMVGTFGLLAEFVLLVVLIWEAHTWLPGGWDESEILGTAGILLLAITAAMAFLKMLHSADTRVAGGAGLVITVASFLLALVAVWLPQGGMTRSTFHDTAWGLWGTAGTLAGVGLLSVAALVGVGGGDRRRWRWAGVASSVVAGCLAVADIWAERLRNEDLLALFVAIAFWVALANPLLHIELKREHRWLRAATLVAGGLAVSLWAMLVWGFEEEVTARAAAACSILAACGAMALSVLARLNRRVSAQDLPRELRIITLFCPLCRKKQTLPLGAAACGACGLKIEVKAEQPTCGQCGYLLYGVTSDRCPECGTPVGKPAAAA
jgi:hypothetical protein